MRFLYVIPLAAAALAIGPRPARALGNDTRSNTKVSVASLTGRTIPAWARKYNMNCSGCHYPTVPRLNATGIGFKWSGYRMPSEIGKNAEVKKIENYLSVRGVVQYVYTKTEKSEADSNMPVPVHLVAAHLDRQPAVEGAAVGDRLHFVDHAVHGPQRIAGDAPGEPDARRQQQGGEGGHDPPQFF